MTKAEEYALKVLDGEILAGRWIKLAAERFMKDLKRKDLIWDVEAVERSTTFFEEVVCVPELGQPVPIPLPHAFWIQQIDGWKYKNGLRRFTSAYIQMARKGFKSFYAGAFSVKELMIGRDHTPSIMIGANNRDQAIICTDLAGKIIKSSEQFKPLIESHELEIFTYRKKTTEIVFETKGRNARIEAMPRDPGDGGNPSVGVIDEFHEANDTSLLETIQSGQGQRLEPLTLVITSPGHNKDGPCYSQLRYNSIQTLEDIIENDRHLAVMFELDEGDEWDDISNYEKSNPMIPYSKTLLPFLEARIEEAKIYGGSKATNIIIKNAGKWVDQSSVWIPSEILKENNKGFTEAQLLGAECYCGVDLAATTDLNAWAFFFPNIEPGIHAVRVHYWIPEKKIRDQRHDAVDYQKWVDDGWMSTFTDNVVEYDVMVKQMIVEMNKFDVRSIGYDVKFFNGGVAPHLKDTKYLEICNPVGQGYSGLSGAVEQVEGWASSYSLDLGGNPVLLWNFSNVELKVGDQGDKIPSKGRSNGRIDGVSAVCDSVAEYQRMHAEPEPMKPFVIGIR